MTTDITKDDLKSLKQKAKERDLLLKRLEQARITIRELRMVNQDLEQKLEQANKQNEDFRKDNLDWKEALNKQKPDINSLRVGNPVATKDSQLEKELKYKDRQIELLSCSIKNKENHITELYALNSDQKKQIKELQDEINKRMNGSLEFITINNQFHDLLTNLELKQLENDQLEESKQKLSIRIKELEEELQLKNFDVDEEERSIIPRFKRTLSLSFLEPERKRIPKPKNIKPEPIDTELSVPAPKTPTPNFHKQCMVGETCISCTKFYGNETLTVLNKHGEPSTVSREERIVMNSRHKQRATTPPGFWDVPFDF